MIGLFCKCILGKRDKALEDFSVEEFSKPEECLGKTLLTVLSLESDLTPEDFYRISCRMQARAQKAPWLMPNGTWFIPDKLGDEAIAAIKGVGVKAED